MDYYKRLVLEPKPVYDKYDSNEVYLEKMQNILSAYPCIGTPREPTALNDGNVFVGSTANAENIPLLKSMGITYILNCERSGLIPFKRAKDIYPKDCGILGYEEIPLEDDSYCNIRSYFARSQRFMEHARSRGNNVLIHSKGVSMSGAIAIAYLINCGYPLLEATKKLKEARRVALVNAHFMEELVEYARDKGMLDADVESIHAPAYHRKLNGYRIKTAHLPLFV